MSGPRFYLWFKLNTNFFMSGKPTSEELQYALVPRKRMPPWSKLVLPAHVITELRRPGGAGA